jgi:hypothetical protein
MDEPTFIVFYTMQMTLFSKLCFNCKSDLPSVSMKVYGTLTTVYQECNICGNGYKWHSQPLVLGRYPDAHGRQSWGGGVPPVFGMEGRISNYSPQLFNMFNEILFLGNLKT